MRRKIIKISLVVAIVFILFMLSRIYHFIMINKVYDAIENFKKEENRYYSVTIANSKKTSIKEEIWIKDKILKYNERTDEMNIHSFWDDFNSNEKYLIKWENKEFTKKALSRDEQNFLTNLPSIIADIYPNANFDIKKFLNISYILPIEYENQKCYKIVADRKVLIVDKNTYLPVCYFSKFTNSNQPSNDRVENRYEFKVGTVTDEDIALPDLTEYTDMSDE